MEIDKSSGYGCAQRMREIAPFYVMEVLGRAQTLESRGQTVIHMEVGEPDFPTPEPIVAAGHRALEAGLTHYTPATGILELRSAIAQYYQEYYGVQVAVERIIATPGASGALQLCLGVLVEPGTAVLLADPGYPCHRHLVRLFEGRPLSVPVDADTNYQLTPELITRHAAARTVAVMLASPSNPTGTVVERRALQEILEQSHAIGARLVVDEIYQRLMYEGEGLTALELSDEVFVINSFSKYFGMTGWRLGWLVAPSAFVPALERLAQNLFLAPPTLSQHAALAAFQPETVAILEARRRELRVRRDFLLPALQGMGFELQRKPQGAFYLYAGCQRFAEDSLPFTLELLDHAGVALTPGRDFGKYRAKGHVRFAYTSGMDALREGVERLQTYLLRYG